MIEEITFITVFIADSLDALNPSVDTEYER